MKKLSETLTELGVAFSFPIEIKDSNGNETYYEHSYGWRKTEYNAKGRPTYFEDNYGNWCKKEYDDASGQRTYFENNYGYKQGTPRSAKTCEGKVIEMDGIKYRLKAL